MSLSRAELEAMDRDELLDAVVDLSQTVEDLSATVATLQEELKEEREMRQDLGTRLGSDMANLRKEVNDVQHDVVDEVGQTEDRLHRERSKLARRVAALEDELDVQPDQAVAIAEGGQGAAQLSKLGRLIRHGPEAVTDNPGATVHRAKAIVDNWDRWGTTELHKDRGVRIRRLGSREHDLRTRLEDARNEDLSWKQVYRAMEQIEQWSDGPVRLKEGQQGKYVLAITEEIVDD